jgi:hypothetical protein
MNLDDRVLAEGDECDTPPTDNEELLDEYSLRSVLVASLASSQCQNDHFK